MTDNTNARLVEKLVKRIKRKKLMRCGLSILCVLVAFLTYHELRFKADTLERVASCGYPDHEHVESCYSDEGVLICEKHVHTDACYQMRPDADEPIPGPTPEPTPDPTPEPTPESTPEPSPEPTPDPSPEPTPEASPEPTPEASPEPTPEASPETIPEPSPEPTPEPTLEPAVELSLEPTPESTPGPTMVSTMDSTFEPPVLSVRVSANQCSAFAGDETSFTVRYEGAGLAAARIVATQDGDVIYESDTFSEIVTVTPARIS